LVNSSLMLESMRPNAMTFAFRGRYGEDRIDWVME